MAPKLPRPFNNRAARIPKIPINEGSRRHEGMRIKPALRCSLRIWQIRISNDIRPARGCAAYIQSMELREEFSNLVENHDALRRYVLDIFESTP
jgi:hypothetical protein